MKVIALTGTTFVTKGLRYIPQSASLLKYLSMPVMMGPIPRPILSAHQPTLSRPSKAAIFAPCLKEQRARGWLHELWHFRRMLAGGCELTPVSASFRDTRRNPARLHTLSAALLNG